MARRHHKNLIDHDEPRVRMCTFYRFVGAFRCHGLILSAPFIIFREKKREYPDFITGIFELKFLIGHIPLIIPSLVPFARIFYVTKTDFPTKSGGKITSPYIKKTNGPLRKVNKKVTSHNSIEKPKE